MRSISIVVPILILSFLFTSPVYAKLVPECGDVDNPCTLCHLLLLIKNVILLLTQIAFAIAALFFIVGGIAFLTSSGSPERIEWAKKTVTNAVIGIALVLMSYLIIASIIVALGGKEAYFSLNLGKGFVIFICQ